MQHFSFNAWTTPQGDDELCPHNETIFIANAPHPCKVVTADLNNCQVHFNTPEGLVVFLAVNGHASLTNIHTKSVKNFKHWNTMQVHKHMRSLWGTVGSHQPTFVEREQPQALAKAKGLFRKLLGR